MITLFTDMDNTMIYSKRRLQSTVDMYTVEYHNNEPLSFMTKKSYNSLKLLNNNEELQIIPVTTRTASQFDRVMLPEFKYELLCNGAVLRVNGRIDYKWMKESETFRDFAYEELQKAYLLLKQWKLDLGVLRFTDELFVFGKFDNPNEVAERLGVALNDSIVNIFTQGKKVYVLPREFDKGYAINRFRQRYETGRVISAGDEVLDFSMADYSDVFITSNRQCYNPNSVLYESNVFSDYILSYVSNDALCIAK